jgi:hypothetical protein
VLTWTGSVDMGVILGDDSTADRLIDVSLFAGSELTGITGGHSLFVTMKGPLVVLVACASAALSFARPLELRTGESRRGWHG